MERTKSTQGEQNGILDRVRVRRVRVSSSLDPFTLSSPQLSGFGERSARSIHYYCRQHNVLAYSCLTISHVSSFTMVDTAVKARLIQCSRYSMCIRSCRNFIATYRADSLLGSLHRPTELRGFYR